MGPITLATAATSLLASFLKKAGAAAMDKLAETLPESVGKFGRQSRTEPRAPRKLLATSPATRTMQTMKCS
jgi:hypothetical protein